MPTWVIIVTMGTLAACAPGNETRSEVPKGSSDATAPVDVTFRPSGVSLNYETGEMEIRGLLAREPGGPPPNRVWVWAYFLNPTEKVDGEPLGGSRSDEPIELTAPFGAGDTARITARGPFHWANNADAPKTGYYARISASARSPEEAEVPVRQRDYNSDHAIRVTIRR